MKESYIKVVDSQHASAELIQQTKEKMREAMQENDDISNTNVDEKTDKVRSNNVYNLRKSYRYIGIAAALLMVFAIGGIWGVNNSIKYEDMNSEVQDTDYLHFGTMGIGKYEVSMEEFEEEFGSDILSVDAIGGYTIVDTKASIINSNENNIVGELAVDYGNYTLDIGIGVDNTVIPLKGAKANEIFGVDVYCGYDGENQIYVACFNIDDIFYKITSGEVSKSEFTKAIKTFVKDKNN